ncbi:hypothetical protein EBZ39_00200 [bacterium]|nr:hypothetical protein [bacterium]
MPIGNWNLQWLNHNSQRAYPLTDRATKTDTTGTIQIPDNFIVGLYFPIHAGTSFQPDKFFIKNLLISPTGFNIVLGYSDGTTTVDVAGANIVRSNYEPNRSYALGGIGNFDDCVGSVVLGVIDDIDALPPGFYSFTQAAGELEPDAIRPMLRAVTRLQILNNSQLSNPIYGHVTLVAGTNIRIDVNELLNETEIVFSAISGTNLNHDCLCNVPPAGECIRCINGVCSPDGTFTFGQDSCVEITPITNGLSFKDTCATPCCGCKELDAITTQLDRFGDGVATLQGFVTRLSGEVTQMSLVVLGSRMADCSSSCQQG